MQKNLTLMGLFTAFLRKGGTLVGAGLPTYPNPADFSPRVVAKSLPAAKCRCLRHNWK
jgi:hypothetical protein